MSKKKGSRKEKVVADYFGVTDERSMSSGAAVGDSDIISHQLGLVFEVKAGKSGGYLPALVVKAMSQAETTGKKYDLDAVSVFVPDNVGPATFGEQGLVIMRPNLFRELVTKSDLLDDLVVTIKGKTFKCID